MLQLLVVNVLHSRGKQIFHPYPHTTLPHISCIVTSPGILGKFRSCGNAFVFQKPDDATNLGVKCFEKGSISSNTCSAGIIFSNTAGSTFISFSWPTISNTQELSGNRRYRDLGSGILMANHTQSIPTEEPHPTSYETRTQALAFLVKSEHHLNGRMMM